MYAQELRKEDLCLSKFLRPVEGEHNLKDFHDMADAQEWLYAM